ncbi:MAG: hypothetical protein C4575_13655 [Desulforudis sp.]|nr:MAG: hypothetical protein C4575_13655 [Desulforudis sp.]
MFGHHHPLTRKTGPAKIAWGLSLPQILALLAGGYLSFRLAQVTPALPFDNFVFAHLHHLLPLGAVALVAFARHGKTGLNYAVYLCYAAAYRLRRRGYVWRR